MNANARESQKDGRLFLPLLGERAGVRASLSPFASIRG